MGSRQRRNADGFSEASSAPKRSAGGAVVEDEPVDHRGDGDGVAEDIGPGLKGLFDETISEARSSRLATTA